MKLLTLLLSLLGLPVLLALARSSPSATVLAGPAPSAQGEGTWTTGAVGTLGDVVYAGENVIDLAHEGIYDPERWVVILDYNTLLIQQGATVRFWNHPSGAPVVIRAVGPITINGTLDLDGEAGHSNTSRPYSARPGPGGFRGGTGRVDLYGTQASAGHGPGGGFLGVPPGLSGSGSHRSPGTGAAGETYGSRAGEPFLGGSGGAGGSTFASYGGGAGGGALLIGSDSSIAIGPLAIVTASGGAGGLSGSGGTIRIASPSVVRTGGPQLLAKGGNYPPGVGLGRIRIESWPVLPPGGFNANPQPTYAALGEFLPSPADLPAVALLSWWNEDLREWVAITQDPHGVITTGGEADFVVPSTGTFTVRLQGRRIPLGAPLHVRTTYTRGQAVVDASHVMGEVQGSTFDLSWTDVAIDFGLGVSTVQVRALL